MAYIPPLNGGRLNASIGGNSTSAGAGYALMSTGTMVLAGGNNITLSQNGNTISISGGAAGAIALANSQTTYTSGTANLVASGALTIASTTGQSFNFSVPQTSSLSATGAISISTNGSTISIGAPIFDFAISSNTAGIGGTVSNGLLLAGGNNITLSQSTDTNGATVTVNGGGGGLAIAGGGTTYTSGTANFSAAGGALTIVSSTAGGNQSLNFSVPQTSSLSATGAISISTNGSTISIGAPAFSAGISTGGNTSGTSGTVSNQLVFAGGNNITLSQATGAGGNTLTISAASQTLQTSNVHNLTLGGNSTSAGAGYIQVSSGTLTLAGGNNITLSQNGNAVTILGGAGGAGVNIAASNTTFGTGTVVMSNNGGALTIGSANQSVLFSVPQTSNLFVANGITASTSSNSITLGAQSPVTLSRWESPGDVFTSIGAFSMGMLSVRHMYVPFNITGSAMKIAGSLSGSTNTSATTASANLSLWMGIYTLNGATLSMASSGSASYGFQWSQSASTTANAATINGLRQLTVPMTVNMTPGEYWVAAAITSATTYTGFAYTMYGNNLINTTAALGYIGSSTSVTQHALLGQGIYSNTTVSTGPASMAVTAINVTSNSNVLRANFYNVIYNTTF